MIHNIEEVLGYFLMFVTCCIFGYVVSLSSNLLLTIYIVVCLLFFLCSICSINENRLRISFLWGLVFFFVAQIIGYATVLAIILGKVLSGEQVMHPIMWLLMTILLLGCTFTILYIKLDKMEVIVSPKKCNVIEFKVCDIKSSVIEMKPPTRKVQYC